MSPGSCTLLNRRPNFGGQGWVSTTACTPRSFLPGPTDGAVSQHSHSYAEDGKVGSPEAPELGLVRTVAYPNGFSEEADGGIVR